MHLYGLSHMYVHTYVVHHYVLEMQRYTIWMYRYITTCVSRYSGILYDTIKCELTDF